MSKGGKWFLGITVLSLSVVGGYALYEYVRVSKINATVTTPQDAMAIINQKLANG